MDLEITINSQNEQFINVFSCPICCFGWPAQKELETALAVGAILLGGLIF